MSFLEAVHYSYYGKIHQYPRSRAITQFRRSDHDQNPRIILTYRLRGEARHEIADYRCRIAISENTGLTMIYSRLKYQCHWCVSVKTFISAMRSCRLVSHREKISLPPRGTHSRRLLARMHDFAEVLRVARL